MLPEDVKTSLERMIANADRPQQAAVDAIFAVQERFGYLSDELLEETARLLRMTPLELEEIATFYEFIFRRPVGKYVLHVCDGLVCWIQEHQTVLDYLREKLGIGLGETTPDMRFTLLPTSCLGYCDRAPALMVNRKVYGELTPERLDRLLEVLK
ncbi:MAG TPA: NADH-quinone oxidoreductase subunit NuoE [Syntrophobacteraceae bacterium]|nr:NADH-quinone oxidoreductase subunit NuoE [Syntrophobacteraceae bacterium]HBD09092.1 NADH-quinone oxidoreductase subunit NuoE [Syntrophobacteraceae bacterium]